ETHRYLAPPPPPADVFHAPIYYQPERSVPEHWIPFVPVHTPNSQREVRLQRGALLRDVVGGTQKIEAQTMVLRAGLEQAPQLPLYIKEAEVPRAGTRVTRGFQRTRWRDGKTFVWLAMARETGRGEDRSGLAFDQIPNATSR